MQFQEAAEKFAKFKSTGSPTIPTVQMKSRGQYYQLDFDLQLIDGAVAIVAKPVKDTEPEPAKKPGKR